MRRSSEQGNILHNMERAREILDVLARNGFGSLVDRLRRHGIAARRKPQEPESAARRLRKALEELGPTFIKLGQILSTRTDLLPVSWCRELAVLQDSVPPFLFDQVEEQLEREFGRPWQELFRHLDPVPVAAASLAQAHAAVLPDGTPVIVKVQRPAIERTIAQDLDILEWLAQLLERRVRESRRYAPVHVVQEFRRSVTSELDFAHEAAATERMLTLFAEDPTVRIPRVYPALSSRRVLTLSRIEGVRIADLPGIRSAGLDPRTIAVNGANAYLRMIFTFGFFHADPHPGNLFACTGNAVGFVDFGLTGHLSRGMREQVADLLIAVADRDASGVISALTALGAVTGSSDRESLEQEFAEYLDRYYVSSLAQFSLSDALEDAMGIIDRHDIRVPAEFTLLIKTLMTVESVARSLDPAFDMITLVTPFARELVQERHSLQALARDLRELAGSLQSAARSLPEDVTEIVHRLSRGTLSVEVRQPEAREEGTALARGLRQLTLGVVAAALLLAGSTLLAAGTPHADLPLLGVILLAAGAASVLWLLLHLRR